MYEHNGYFDPAYSQLLVEILEQMLRQSGRPDRVGYALDEQVREITGASLVILLPPEDIQGLIVYPESRREIAESLEARALFKVAMQTDHIMLWDKRSRDPVAERLLSAGQMKNCLSVPLSAGNERMGTLVIMDFNVTGDIDSLMGIMDRISGVLGLIIRNEGFYRENEQLAEERTHELTDINEKLMKEINERKRVEEALRRSEANLKKSQEIAHLGSFEWDLIEHRNIWSDEMYHIIGVDPGDIDPCFETLIEFVHPDDQDNVKTALMEALDNIKPLNLEHRMIRPDGSIRWIHAEGKVLFEGSGHPASIFGTMLDITDNKKVQDEIKTERLRFFSLLDNLPAFIYLQAPDHSIPFANRNFKKIFGDPKGRPCYDAIQGRDKPCPVCPTLKVFTTREPQKWEFTAANGHIYQIYDYPFIDVNGMPLVMEMGIDITERKQVEEALRESKASLVKAQRIAHVGNYVLDLVNDRMDCSDEFYSILGLAPRDYFSYKSLLTFLHTDDREIFYREFREARDQGKAYNNDFRIVRPDGSVRIIHWEGEMALDGTGKPIQMFGITQDITERKAIVESLRKLSRAVEESPATVVITDVLGDIEYVNPKFTSLTGYTLEEAIGKNPRILKSGKTPEEEYERLWETICAGNEWRGEFLNKKKNGELYWESAIISPIKDDRGRITHYMAIKEDITERKQAAEALKLTQFSIDRAADEIFWITPEGRVSYVNNAACNTLQYSREELQSMNVWDFDPTYTKGKWEEHWQEIKKRGSFTMETQHRAKNGRIFPAEVSVNYVKFGDKEFNFAYIKDITERKKAENELKEAKFQAELYLDLMGHDINNMNQIALGFLEMAEDVIKSGGELGEDNRELIEKPMTSLNSSSRLIDRVMKLRKLKMRGSGLEHVDICNVLNRVKDRYMHITERDMTINYTPYGECSVEANELIDEIFINLIENSLKHSPNDKPLVIDIFQTKVFENGKEFNRISVEDNGPGIPDEIKEKLFARFYRGQTMAKGNGLGLYLVRTLVEDFGGRIWAEDRLPGDSTKGVKFVVMLPTIKQ